jgi:hypothetical protein
MPYYQIEYGHTRGQAVGHCRSKWLYEQGLHLWKKEGIQQLAATVQKRISVLVTELS